ncbi:MAG: hypothetical protein IMY75_03215 [Chloroflexi bacterium]|nr:hypothetical protein [Chloroflexota bacterium]
MRVEYSDYLKFRLTVRGIPGNMPERIYRESQERYYDKATGRHIAVLSVAYHRRRKRMMIAYDEFSDHVEIVTIHPIEKQQIQNRVLSGRWIYE